MWVVKADLLVEHSEKMTDYQLVAQMEPLMVALTAWKKADLRALNLVPKLVCQKANQSVEHWAGLKAVHLDRL